MDKQAKNNPVRGSAPEAHSEDIKVRQRPAIDLGEEREQQAIITAEEDDEEIVLAVASERDAQGQQNALLAFMEEPVQIVIQKSQEKFAANVVDCWVNGRGAEQFVNGKWMVCGWLPVNTPVVTKRKFVEVLARAKADSIQATEVKESETDEQLTLRFTHTKYPFSIMHDHSGIKGINYLMGILQQQ